MKRISCLIIALFAVTILKAQLPAGTIAADFNVTDINGNQHHLYSYLNQGKSVILDFSAAWCPLCWSYHNSKALSDFYTLYGPNGTDEAMVLFIERDAQMGIDDLNGLTNATTGDWVTGTPYPIIDTSGLNDDYSPNALPTIYGVHPDRVVTTLGTRSTEELIDFVRSFEPIDSMVPDTVIEFSVRSVRDITCFGQSDGSIDIDVGGPATSFTYAWSNGQTSQDMDGLPAGIYSCVITDNLGNEFDTPAIVVSEPEQLIVSFLSNTPSSSTATDGSLIANVSGGIPPYSYTWQDASTNMSIDNIGEGEYSVAIVDANGCQTSDEFALVVPTCALFLAINVEPTTCDENADGQVNLLVERAQGGVSYNWNTGDTIQNLIGVRSGGYEVTVTDDLGCSSVASGVVAINDPIAPVARIRDEFFDVYLGEDGTAFLSPEQVDSGSFDNCAILGIQLSEDEFDCTEIGRNFVEFAVIDEALNMTRREIEVTVIDSLSPYFECEDTSITVQACNGVVNYTPPRIVDNCPFGSSTSLLGRGSGAVFPVGVHTETYNYLTSDGLRATCNITINVESWISAQVSVNDVTCPGEDDGSATVLLNNASGSYDYTWSDGQTTGAAVGLSAGNYSVSVIDSNECNFDFDFFVGEPVSILARVDSIRIPDGRGDIFVSVFGGRPPYSYQWFLNDEVVATVQDPQNLNMGLYRLRITDSNDCEYDLFGIQVGSLTSTEELSVLSKLVVSPNPNNGHFYLTPPVELLGQEADINIFNLLGQTLHIEKAILREQTEIHTILPHGLLLLEVQSDGKRITRKILIE